MKAKLLLLSSIILLSACSEEGGNLQEWMNQKKAEAKTKVRPVEEPAKIRTCCILSSGSIWS